MHDSLPPYFEYDVEEIYEVAEILGWPWQHSKTKSFSPQFRYIGFDWDIPGMRVSIPLEKRIKFTKKITDWSAKPSATLKETESLLGSLIHCSLAVPEGRSHAVGLARFTSNFSHAYQHRFNTRTRTLRASEDALWWAGRLTQDDCGSDIHAPPPLIDPSCYMDASTSFGIGIIVDSEYGMWQLSDNWAGNGRDIGWAEIVAIELTLTTVIDKGIKAASVLFWSDNQGVIGAIKAGRSRNDQQNLVLQRISERAAQHDIHLHVEYIATNDNPADAPSRGVYPTGLHPLKSYPQLDAALVPFLTPYAY